MAKYHVVELEEIVSKKKSLGILTSKDQGWVLASSDLEKNPAIFGIALHYNCEILKAKDANADLSALTLDFTAPCAYIPASEGTYKVIGLSQDLQKHFYLQLSEIRRRETAPHTPLPF